MKTNTLARIYALAMSALFATIATVGVATMMATTGEQARTALNDQATAAGQDAQAASPAFTRWESAPAKGAAQQL